MDPDINALVLAATALHQRGEFNIYLSKIGNDGMKRLDELQPDALIVDPQAKLQDGSSFLDALAESTPHASLKIFLAVSAPGKAPAATDRFPVPVAGILHKPYNAAKLGKEIESVLGVSPNPARVAEIAEHLNSEIQRVMGNKSPA